MIVIYCSSFAEAQEAYDIFLYYLMVDAPVYVVSSDSNMLTIDTDDDLRYVFIDYPLLPIFERLTIDIIDVDTFFYDWEAYYAR